MNPDLCIIKFDNWLLYDNDKYQIFKKLTQFSPISNIKVSRIDICSDFNEFDNGYSVQTFFRLFMKNKYLKNNQPHYKLEAIQKKINTYQHHLEWLSFGSNTSNIKSYIYNKSLEMAQVKFKQWISDSWSQNGIDSAKDVYRLEFALHPGTIKLAHTETGDIFNITYFAIQQAEFINNLYVALIYKYFDFRLNDGSSKKCRMKRVKLFDLPEIIYLFTKDIANSESNRSDKILINKCLQTFNDLRNIDRNTSNDYKRIACTHATTENLILYYQKKLIILQSKQLAIKQNNKLLKKVNHITIKSMQPMKENQSISLL